MITTNGFEVVLINIAWLLLIAVGFLLVMVLSKLAFLLHSVSEFFGVVRYELFPVLKELRQTASHLQVLSGKLVDGLNAVEKGVEVATPPLQQGLRMAQNVTHTVSQRAGNGVSSLLGGIRRSFQTSSKSRKRS
jgi:hypothetical protein